ncbi:flagellar hook-associated protein FlgK [Ornithinibacillus halotolerans]|uniref:Flagellar hook-associated protein 1 n=1 Tax=Ornithinibacillus halotolerans TaxID=1274357 RepID=A0A916RRQ4_9BACI|nr:flagellar hook-associated protein FlgK [Ornithinibacillus halotolerans]GGA67186.1 hypothetical protein GCM10008025_08780 [Ornithinibacillus halotolerans]
MSTFHGLEMAKRALAAQQAALYTTGHNISNANTDGYTRQRVNLETLPAYPAASRNAPKIAGQLGQGVEAASVERIRDSFLDSQYRTENGTANYWETKSNALRQIEGIFNEPSDSGLATVMNKFWQSLQDLSVNPDNAGVQAVVVERGETVAETFNHLIKNLNGIQSNLEKEIDGAVKEANALLNHLSTLNTKIKELEFTGQTPNDLYDNRDKLIDELSGFIDVKALGLENSESINIVYEDNEIKVNGNTIDEKSGSIQALLDTYQDNNDYLQEVKDLASSFANEFNDIIQVETGEGSINFFEFNNDELQVSDETSNVSAFILNRDKLNQFKTFNQYEQFIGRIGIDTQEANRMTEYTNTLKTQIENQRMSISSVSLDEEMTNMIKFQHAYNAAARSMTAMDEMLDRIINNMGIVGR